MLGEDNPFKARQEQKDEEARLKKCVFCHSVSSLDAEQRNMLREAFEDPAISAPTIVDVLEDWGLKSTVTVVGTHRTSVRSNCAPRIARNWDRL